jgi:DNA-binding transcriptional LysR family regulator
MGSSVELRELRVFLTLAEELHFGRAAGRLHLTHSRVSQCIASLESRAGARLFERTSRRVRLTPMGEQLRARVAPACEEIESALADLRGHVGGVSGTLRLGMYSRVAAGPHLIEIIRTFERRHQRCRVELADTGLSMGQFDALRHGELDLLACRLPFAAPGLVVGPVLAVEERVLVLARDHPLAGRPSVSVEDLAGYTTTDVEGAPRAVMDGFSPPVTPSGRPIRRAYVRSISEAAARAAAGELVHPTVASFLDYHSDPQLTAVPIRDLPPSRTALVRTAAGNSPKVTAFIQTATDVLKDRGLPILTTFPPIAERPGRRGSRHPPNAQRMPATFLRARKSDSGSPAGVYARGVVLAAESAEDRLGSLGFEWGCSRLESRRSLRRCWVGSSRCWGRAGRCRVSWMPGLNVCPVRLFRVSGGGAGRDAQDAPLSGGDGGADDGPAAVRTGERSWRRAAQRARVEVTTCRT